MEKHYYHMFANGDDAKDFITTEEEFKAAFNRFGVCSVGSGVTVLSCSAEDSHPHALLYGTLEDCLAYKNSYELRSKRSIVQKRGSLDGVNLHCELYEIENESYLRNVAAYTIVQATKDGKAVMPYDYLYGTGALYFRTCRTILPWLIGNDGSVCTPRPFGALSVREKKAISLFKTGIPDNWLICNGFILPTCYIDVRRYESIFRTHNCFRVFLSSGRNKDDEIVARMSSSRGVLLEDLEARRLCHEACRTLFGKDTTRILDAAQRITLSRYLRKNYRLSYRQLSTLTKVPESELRKYV